MQLIACLHFVCGNCICFESLNCSKSENGYDKLPKQSNVNGFYIIFNLLLSRWQKHKIKFLKNTFLKITDFSLFIIIVMCLCSSLMHTNIS